MPRWSHLVNRLTKSGICINLGTPRDTERTLKTYMVKSLSITLRWEDPVRTIFTKRPTQTASTIIKSSSNPKCLHLFGSMLKQGSNLNCLTTRTSTYIGSQSLDFAKLSFLIPSKTHNPLLKHVGWFLLLKSEHLERNMGAKTEVLISRDFERAEGVTRKIALTATLSI